MSSRARRQRRKLALGLRACSQYIRAFERRAPADMCDTLFVAHRARFNALARRYDVATCYRNYLRHVGIDITVIWRGK